MESGECVAQVSPDYATLHPGYTFRFTAIKDRSLW